MWPPPRGRHDSRVTDRGGGRRLTLHAAVTPGAAPIRGPARHGHAVTRPQGELRNEFHDTPGTATATVAPPATAHLGPAAIAAPPIGASAPM